MWLVSRASGLVLLVVFSAVIVLGIAVKRDSLPKSLRRFVAVEVHRTLSLFGLALLAVHVLTAVLDPYVSIGWWATIVPFLSHYRTAALGFGTLAVDFMAAVIATSLLRRWVGYRVWRATHWLAYLSWPVAVVHVVSAGNDMGIWWVATLVWGSVFAVGSAIALRFFSPVGRLRTMHPTRSGALTSRADRRPMVRAGGSRC
jgi:predicted ferric reductase